MNEPARWRDQGPAEMRELFRRARPTRDMTAEERRRTTLHVSRLAMLPVGVGLLFWIKGLAIGATLGVAALVTVKQVVPAILQTDAPAPSSMHTAAQPPASFPPARIVSERPAETLVDAAPAASLSAAAPAPPGPIAPAVSESAAPPTSMQADTLQVEARLLEQARAALRSNPAEALRLTQEHASSFPNGALGSEREFVAMDALRRLGRVQEARARGEALMSRSTDNLYKERIRRLLDGMK